MPQTHQFIPAFLLFAVIGETQNIARPQVPPQLVSGDAQGGEIQEDKHDDNDDNQ